MVVLGRAGRGFGLSLVDFGKIGVEAINPLPHLAAVGEDVGNKRETAEIFG